MKRKACMAFFLISLVICMSGCVSKLPYTDEEMEVIANHAAAIVMKHDERLYDRYLDEEKNSINESGNDIMEEEITTKVSESTESDLTGTTGHSGTIQEETTEAVSEDSVATTQQITQAMDIHGLTAEYLGFTVTSEYPYDNSESGIFVMKATRNTKLLTVKFRLSNQTEQDISINMMDKNRRYPVILNETTRLNVQLTLLKDALNTFEGTLKPGESINLVLVYQTKVQSETDVQHLDIIFTGTAGTETKVRLK